MFTRNRFRIEMNAINSTATCDGLRIKKMTSEIGGNPHLGLRKIGASLLGATKFRRDAPPWRADLRWANYQNWWHQHSWLNGRLPDLIDKRGYALGH
jgi:hypothetical protein